jgi:hypothetical protein
LAFKSISGVELFGGIKSEPQVPAVSFRLLKPYLAEKRSDSGVRIKRRQKSRTMNPFGEPKHQIP